MKGETFVGIAKALGLTHTDDANLAFNRALRLRPAEEQATLRARESKRLDRQAEKVRANAELSPDDIEKRLHTIERLRARLAAT